MQELFSNDNYAVKVNEQKTSYLIVNNKTEVVEHETTMLPEALKVAYLMDEALKENVNHTRDQINRALSDIIVPPDYNRTLYIRTSFYYSSFAD